MLWWLACAREEPSQEQEPPQGEDPLEESSPEEDPSEEDPPEEDPPEEPLPWLTGASWQWQLSGAIDTSIDVEIYDVDLVETPDEVLEELHAAGRRVICYFSAGSQEDWREDADDFPPDAVGEPLDGWPGERWVDIRDEGIREIMLARLDLAQQRGCDAVEPDNVDGWQNDSGFDLTRADQLDYNTFLAEQSHARGLAVGLKNTVELADELEPLFDWTLNEECLAYDECRRLSAFVDAGKAVLHVEYVDRPAQGEQAALEVCGDPSLDGFSTLIKTWDLDAWRLACE
jgi:hypothetical protein